MKQASSTHRTTSSRTSWVTCVLRQGVFNGDEILERFGHLAASDRQVPGVQEVSDPVIILKESLWGEKTTTTAVRILLSLWLEMALNMLQFIISNYCLNVFCAFNDLRPVKVKERLWFCTSDWANSLSWWGNRRSKPPPWMSMDSPRTEPAMAEHSICQPGLPCYNNQKEKQQSIMLIFYFLE